jgi:hypothetical protein
MKARATLLGIDECYQWPHNFSNSQFIMSALSCPTTVFFRNITPVFDEGLLYVSPALVKISEPYL